MIVCIGYIEISLRVLDRVFGLMYESTCGLALVAGFSDRLGPRARIGAVVPHMMFWATRIKETDLSDIEPFRLAAEALADKVSDRGELTVLVAGVRVEGDDQFMVLATYAKAPGAWWPVGSDDLMDRRCLR